MASDRHHAYTESVRRVMSAGLYRACGQNAPRVMEKLTRLRDETAGKHEDEVVALLRAELFNDMADATANLRAQTLMLRGYDEAHAYAMAEQFHRDKPQFDPTMARMMGKDALEEELGPFYGRMVSSMLVDPGCQPILHAILFANDADPVKETQLTCVTRTMSCMIVGKKEGVEFSSWSVLDYPGVITNQLAASHYYRVTGQTLPDKVALHTHPWK